MSLSGHFSRPLQLGDHVIPSHLRIDLSDSDPAGLLRGGIGILVHYFKPQPRLDQLDKLTGIVQHTTGEYTVSQKTVQYPALRIGESRERYGYMNWFPRSSQLTSVVRAGEPATIWTDSGNNKFIWQIEQNGQTLVRYEEIRDAIIANNQAEIILGPLVLLLGVYFTYTAIRERRAPN